MARSVDMFTAALWRAVYEDRWLLIVIGCAVILATWGALWF